MRRVTSFLEDVDGVECDLMYEPIEWIDMRTATVGDKRIVGYCVQDDVCRIEDLIGGCMGQMYSFARWVKNEEHREGERALGLDRDGEPDLDEVWERHAAVATERLLERLREEYPAQDIADLYEGTQYEREFDDLEEYVESCVRQDCNDNDWGSLMCYDDMQKVLTDMFGEDAYFPGDKDAVLLDVYDHSGQSWSISGRGMQCVWDTARGAGVWVPDESLRAQLDSDEAKGLDRRAQRLIYCQQFLDMYNDAINGNVFGVVVEVFDENGEQIADDACWGYVGDEHAEESLKDAFEYQKQQLEQQCHAQP